MTLEYTINFISSITYPLLLRVFLWISIFNVYMADWWIFFTGNWFFVWLINIYWIKWVFQFLLFTCAVVIYLKLYILFYTVLFSPYYFQLTAKKCFSLWFEWSNQSSPNPQGTCFVNILFPVYCWFLPFSWLLFTIEKKDKNINHPYKQ